MNDKIDPAKAAEIKAQIEAASHELDGLNDLQLISLALSAIVLSAENLPVEMRLPLYQALRRRTGLDDNKTEILHA